jgi:hypothetical protein
MNLGTAEVPGDNSGLIPVTEKGFIHTCQNATDARERRKKFRRNESSRRLKGE